MQSSRLGEEAKKVGGRTFLLAVGGPEGGERFLGGTAKTCPARAQPSLSVCVGGKPEPISPKCGPGAVPDLQLPFSRPGGLHHTGHDVACVRVCVRRGGGTKRFPRPTSNGEPPSFVLHRARVGKIRVWETAFRRRISLRGSGVYYIIASNLLHHA